MGNMNMNKIYVLAASAVLGVISTASFADVTPSQVCQQVGYTLATDQPSFMGESCDAIPASNGNSVGEVCRSVGGGCSPVHYPKTDTPADNVFQCTGSVPVGPPPTDFKYVLCKSKSGDKYVWTNLMSPGQPVVANGQPAIKPTISQP
jgi:hypothetical protein